jgi:hypothetical protein
VTVTASQISKAKAARPKFENIDAIAAACDKTKCMFYLALAMFDKESDGRNVYGSDSGGALRGYKGPVDAGSYRIFRWMVDEGIPVKQPDGSHKTVKFGPNGIGPAQITHPDLVAEMRTRNLSIIDAKDNIFFGTERLYKLYRHARDVLKLNRHDSIKSAGKRYNGAAAYGEDLLKVALAWKEIVGNDENI